MLWSFVYTSFVRLVELLVWMFRSEDAKDVEILVLRHELGVLPPGPSARTAARGSGAAQRVEPHPAASEVAVVLRDP